MTNPIEVMAKAYQEESSRWSHGHLDHEPGFHFVWRDGDVVARLQNENEIRNIMVRMRADAAMRAAVSALSGCDLPGDGRDEDREFLFHFRAMLKKLAENK
jgi:hypothetical protein